jgi:hypothetical protein
MLATQIAPTIAEDDALFDEVASLNRIVEQISVDQLESKTLEQKWKKIFSDGNFPCLLALISTIFPSRFPIHSLRRSFRLPKINGPTAEIHCYQLLSRHCFKSTLITAVARCILICSITRTCSKRSLTMRNTCDCIIFCLLFTFVFIVCPRK